MSQCSDAHFCQVILADWANELIPEVINGIKTRYGICETHIWCSDEFCKIFSALVNFSWLAAIKYEGTEELVMLSSFDIEFRVQFCSVLVQHKEQGLYKASR